MLEPQDEIAELYSRSTEGFSEALARVGVARGLLNDDTPALRALGKILRETELLADLLGRRRLLLEADAARRTFEWGSTARSWNEFNLWSATVPRVPFAEAVDEILAREPRLVSGWREAQEVYTQARGFALAQSLSRGITERVRDVIAESLSRGRPVPEASALVAETGQLARATAETAYRTNVASAYTAGRFRQALDPDVAAVVAGFEFVVVNDKACRPNHLAARGLVAGINDPVWDYLAPPLGYRCRCTLRSLDRFEARRSGLLDESGKLLPAAIPPGAGPDPGFVSLGRPDREVYGTSPPA